MNVFAACFALHLLAAFVWLGHMFFWSLFGGPMLKKIDPPETASRLRAVSMRVGGLGWPALLVLVSTGAYLLGRRGIGLDTLLSAELLATTVGRAIALKLVLVAGMVLYQIAFAHRRAPRAIYLNMLAALLILGASVVLAGW